jgi:hypothetical protein
MLRTRRFRSGRRFQFALNEVNPALESLHGYPFAEERNYANSNAADVIADFRSAGAKTMQLLSNRTPEQLRRNARFEGYGSLTVHSLAHYLCSQRIREARILLSTFNGWLQPLSPKPLWAHPELSTKRPIEIRYVPKSAIQRNIQHFCPPGH